MDPSYQDLAEEEGGSPFDLKVLLLYGLLRSKLWVIVLTSVGLFGGLLVGAAAPNEYQSEARLRYVPGERDRLTEDELAGIESSDRRGSSAPGLVDEIMLLENAIIYQRVAERLGPSRVLEPPDPQQYDTHRTSWPVRMLHKLQKMLIEARGTGEVDDQSPKALRAAWRKLKDNTTLKPYKGAATISVLHRASSAAKAQEFCTVLVEALQERHREVFSAEAHLESQRQKVSEAQEKYSQAEEAWNAYRVVCEVFDYEEDIQANQLALRELNKLLDEKQGQLLALKAKILVYESRLSMIKEFVEERIDAAIGKNPKFTSLQQEIDELELELLILVDGSLPPNTLKERRNSITKQLENLRAELANTEPTIEVLPARTEQRKNPEYYDLQVDLVLLQAERDGVIAGIEHCKEQLQSLQGRREVIASCRDKHTMHRAQVDAARTDLDMQWGQLDKLEKLALAEMKGSSALKPVWEPTLPMGKIGPSRLKPLLAGLAAGMFLGLAFAVLRQLLDRRLRYPETLEKGLGLRVIGVVPEVRRLRGLPGKGPTPTAA